ncbi:MAG: CAAX prenyl protease-related protein [Akkermansia sp.]
MSREDPPEGDALLYRAYVYPLVLFLGFNLLLFAAQAVLQWDHPAAPWWRRAPEMAVYPLQTLACAVYLWRVRRDMELGRSASACLFGVAAGVVGIGFWLIPYAAGLIPAEGGFLPARIFPDAPAVVVIQYVFRFARAVLIVPLVEELFWRGFLMRWCIDRDFPQSVPIGRGSWLAYAVTTVAFMLAHNPADYAGAFVYGSIAYFVTIRTRALLPVIIMHAVANLIMGICAVTCDLPHLW